MKCKQCKTSLSFFEACMLMFSFRISTVRHEFYIRIPLCKTCFRTEAWEMKLK